MSTSTNAFTIWPDTVCPACHDSHFRIEASGPSNVIRICWCGERVTLPADDPSVSSARRRLAARLRRP